MNPSSNSLMTDFSRLLDRQYLPVLWVGTQVELPHSSHNVAPINDSTCGDGVVGAVEIVVAKRPGGTILASTYRHAI
jgi:hypothetical protein